MGGNALQGRRIHVSEYKELCDEVLKMLNTIEGNFKFKVIPSYAAKEEFGDVDIIATNWDYTTSHKVLSIFGNPEHVSTPRNPEHIYPLSFKYKGVQIDIIPVHAKSYDIALTYFSYNDLGNLMGKIARRFGLKYGHEGLVMPLYHATNTSYKLGDVTLSIDPGRIFNFLGFDYKKFLEGFDSLGDIFDFVVNSDFFQKDVFSYEKMNSAARARDKKRPTYTSFLKYIEPLPFVIKSTDPFPTWGTLWFFTIFPEALPKYMELLQDYEECKTYTEAIDNTDVLRWILEDLQVSLVGKEIGDFLKFARIYLFEYSKKEQRIRIPGIYDAWILQK
jgi:hypothetical protein